MAILLFILFFRQAEFPPYDVVGDGQIVPARGLLFAVVPPKLLSAEGIVHRLTVLIFRLWHPAPFWGFSRVCPSDVRSRVAHLVTGDALHTAGAIVPPAGVPITD